VTGPAAQVSFSFITEPRSRSQDKDLGGSGSRLGNGESVSGKVLDSREEMCNVVHGKGVMIWQ